MNKHLLQTKLKSILHYREEIKRLKDATKVTEETLLESLNGLAEFWPYTQGDVLIFKGKMMKISKLTGMTDSYNPSFVFNYEFPEDRYGKFQWKISEYTATLPIADLDKVKVIDASTFE